ncbi:hypothetical protein [Bacillus xiapuensis]|uniref:hypothetical protein n=1 Tax=Bacillus xiapuensis TaxID=2014075 RepID=UPI000C234930|nr:hypothetical protein [Bacillus xiapuensis]
MFTLDDMVTFAWAFFITLPATFLIHITGHVFFAKLFGARTELIIGKGKKLLKLGKIEIRQFYFTDAACIYDKIRKERRWKHALIYAGGSLFNILSIIIVNGMILADIWPKHLFFYQFVYFSIYYVFFALLPIDYGENHPSDGKAIFSVLKYGKTYKKFD